MHKSGIVKAKPIYRPRGVTLIMVAAVLAILAALGTGFYTMMLMASRSAVHYSDAVRAEMMAKAGIQYAIAGLREQAYKKTEDPTDPWYMVDYLHGATKGISFPDSPLLHDGLDNDNDGIADNLDEINTDRTKNLPFSRTLGNTAGSSSDRFNLNVSDAASKINVNQCDNLAVLLDNLCRVIGPPLVAADQTMTYERVFEYYGGIPGKNAKDWPASGKPGTVPYGVVPRDIYYWLYASDNATVVWDFHTIFTGDGRPLASDGVTSTAPVGVAVYGDGYAIAGYRAKHGKFHSIDEVKNALTYVERSNPVDNVSNDPLERLEIEVKFAAIKDYITISSYVDTNTVCVGKFEWVYGTVSGVVDTAVDRDKSWIPDDPVNDPQNLRGSLRGCYLSIINGHGAGQLRRIKTNGVDWVQIDVVNVPAAPTNGFVVPPGPNSSYMIVAQEDATLVDVNGNALQRPVPYGFPPGVTSFPKTNLDGTLADDPDIDYVAKPLCIHRSPINVNTASDKVLAALFMGINVTQGHFLSIGTDVDMAKLTQYNTTTGALKSRWTWQAAATPTSAPSDWYIDDYDNPNQNPYRTVEPYIITPKGVLRIPADDGFISYDVDYATVVKPKLPPAYDMSYLNNYGTLDPGGTTKMNEANELAYRVIIARQFDAQYPYIDPLTGAPSTIVNSTYRRGAFKSWDDLYFRVVKPWDDQRQLRSIDGAGIQHKASVARVIMAQFNSNLDILKFNPNIEWIDRWGRNFTELEPIFAYTNAAEAVIGGSLGHGQIDSNLGTITDITPATTLNMNAVPVFCRERIAGYTNPNPGVGGYGQGTNLFVVGPYGTAPQNQGSYIVRGFRYKSDEMIDKTDLNRSTTEFSFDSGGIYTIQSIGSVVQNGGVLAERRADALVKVYDVWRETTQRQFVQGTISLATGTPGMATSGQIARDQANVGPNNFNYLALTTLPEPLVPLAYTINNNNNFEIVDTTISATNRKRNAWGAEVNINVPLIVANKVLPAGYDGQIVLATNTARFDSTANGDSDTFLASFNGDLDTETCLGNGHEQAKTPINCQVQVMDCIGLLGALNDTQIDMDQGLNATTPVTPDMPTGGTYAGTPMQLLEFRTAIGALRGLDPNGYWNNMTCRQGDLRPDGAYVGAPGVSGNDGVLKYLCGNSDPSNYANQNFNLNGVGAQSTNAGAAGSEGNVAGSLISMWFKPQWHQNDNRHHEFFNASNPGWRNRCEAYFLNKMGRNNFSCNESMGSTGAVQVGTISATQESGVWGLSGTANRNNDLAFCSEDIEDQINNQPTENPNKPGVFDQYHNGTDCTDPDYLVYMHGGISGVPTPRLTLGNAAYNPESPSYRVQPFRWGFIGARNFLHADFRKCTNVVPYNSTSTSTNGISLAPSGWGAAKSGFWKQDTGNTGAYMDQDMTWQVNNLKRPFIDSERWPEGTSFTSAAKFWTVQQVQGSAGYSFFQDKALKGQAGQNDGGFGQDVRWSWASPGGTVCNTEGSIGGGQTQNYKIFGLNNCNLNVPNATIYRHVAEEGTYAVIDEFKISRKETTLQNPPDWTDDRITRPLNAAGVQGEIFTSRYYLPVTPTDPTQCPTFTSQTMLQSLKGFVNVTAVPPEYVELARVSWNCFTPRFMSEYQAPNSGGRPLFSRQETITQNGSMSMQQNGSPAPVYLGAGSTPSNIVPYKGPFDWCKYNNITSLNSGLGGFNGTSAINGSVLLAEQPEDFDDPAYNNVASVYPYRCARPAPDKYALGGQYKQPQYTRGIEVEILNNGTVIPGASETAPGSGVFNNSTGTFVNPDTVNRFLDATSNPVAAANVRTDQLRYRVRFRYPTDALADGYNAANVVDPTQQYLLDTPVFDDIAVTYFSQPQILDYQDVTE